MKIFKLPDLGEGLPDAEIHEWHVKVGDVVNTDDPLVSMETAKAVVDVPAPFSGKVVKLHGKPGDVINTHSPLVEFETEGSNEPTQMVKDNPQPAKVSASRPDSGTVAGTIEVGSGVLEESVTGIQVVPSQESRWVPGVKATPSVRSLARRLQVNLAEVSGTGKKGLITRADVEQAAQARGIAPKVATLPLRSLSTAQEPLEPGFDPLRGVRRAMAHTMAKSHQEVAAVTLVDDADIDAWPKGTDISLRIVRAIQKGCEASPQLNAWFNQNNQSVKVMEEVNLGIAMDSEEGLFVPVLKDVANQTDETLRETVNRFKAQVRNRDIPQEDLKGATLVLSNFGTLAGRYANPMITPPTVAIVGTGKIRQEAVVRDGQVVARTMMPLAVTVDHRVVTGGEAARFLAAMIEALGE